MRKIIGALAILGAVAASPGSGLESAARDAALIGGIAAVQSGIAKGKEAKIHVEGLKELAASFDSEIEPLLVEVEGHTLRLEGSAEAQYAEFRQLLREIFVSETGLPAEGEERSEAATPADRGSPAP